VLRSARLGFSLATDTLQHQRTTDPSTHKIAGSSSSVCVCASVRPHTGGVELSVFRGFLIIIISVIIYASYVLREVDNGFLCGRVCVCCVCVCLCACVSGVLLWTIGR
jgi:uncharacterized integral membrane protein